MWHSGITLEQQITIERVQKSALAVILGKKYVSYQNALKITNLKRLSIRRESICLKFTIKNLKSDNSILEKNLKIHKTRSGENLVKEIQCRTKSFFTSSVPFLARQYNNHLKTKKG